MLEIEKEFGLYVVKTENGETLKRFAYKKDAVTYKKNRELEYKMIRGSK